MKLSQKKIKKSCEERKKKTQYHSQSDSAVCFICEIKQKMKYLLFRDKRAPFSVL